MRKSPTISYRMPADFEPPVIGSILMGEGPRVRRAYRILTIRQVRPGWLRDDGHGGYEITWKLTVERVSATIGRDEIAAGVPWYSIVWDKRSKKSSTQLPRWRCHNCGYSNNRAKHCDGCDLTESEGDARD